MRLPEPASPLGPFRQPRQATRSFTATATGTTYGESFSGNGAETINVDTTPPTVTITPPPTYSPTLSPTFTWSATDSESTVASYDVEAAVDQGGWVSQLIDTTNTSISLTAAEGQLIRLRVRATDSLDNTSDWSEVSTTLDSLPPVVSFGTVDSSVRGTIRVPVIISNAGSPTTANFTFSDTVGGRTGSVANGTVLQYKNTDQQDRARKPPRHRHRRARAIGDDDCRLPGARRAWRRATCA